MSKGSHATTTNSSSSTAPDPAAMAAYQNLLLRAQTVSNKPYQAFTGEETAPINAQQRAGFGNINAGVAGFDPNQAWSNIGQGTSAVDANDINQYMDPYTNQVINATQADFDTQNQRANSIVTGNAAAQGALGGNRVGVAQALTQEGATRAQAPVIAGLRSAGFQSAEQMANTQKARQIQGGATAEQLGMQGAGAQVGAGTLEQQTQQHADTQQMQDYFRAQGYDFQTASWLASLVLPTGSQMGSSSTGVSATQGPTPNTWAQGAGLGIAAAGLFIKDGGRIPGFAAGGAPYSGGVGWVPDVGAINGSPLRAAPFPQHANMAAPKDNSAKLGEGLGKIGKGLYDKYGVSQGDNGLSTDASDNGTGIYTGDASMPGFSGGPSWGTGDGAYWARGGGVRRGFESGGVPISTGFGGGAYDDDLSPNDAVNERFANPYLGSDQYKNYGADSKSLVAEGLARHPDIAVAENAPLSAKPVKTLSYIPTPELKPSGVARNDIVPTAQQAFKNINQGVAPEKALGYADDGEGTSDATDFSAARRGAPSGVAAAPDAQSRKGLFGLNLSDEARQGLISMGLGMMANRQGGKGSFLASVGQGGEQGMQTYASAKAQTAQRQLEQQRLEQARLMHNTMTPYQKEMLARENLSPVGTTDDGYPLYIDKRTGKEVIGQTKVQQKAPSGYVKNPDGSMSAIKGGPADPEIVAGMVKAKSGAQIPDATADFLAERVITGDSKALVGLGRGAQGAENIIRIQTLVAQKAAERGLNASDILAKIAEQSGLTASQRTFGTQIAKMAVNSTEAEGAIQQGLEVSKNVPRTKFVPINKLVQMAEGNISDPDLLEFRAANLAIINTYARAISPTGTPTVHDKEEAMKVVSEATSPEAYERVMRRMLKEIAIAHAAPAQAKKELERIRKASNSAEPAHVAAEAKPETTRPAADQQAIDWANANPTDSRAAAIKKKLGVQ